MANARTKFLSNLLQRAQEIVPLLAAAWRTGGRAWEAVVSRTAQLRAKCAEASAHLSPGEAQLTADLCERVEGLAKAPGEATDVGVQGAMWPVYSACLCSAAANRKALTDLHAKEQAKVRARGGEQWNSGGRRNSLEEAEGLTAL